MRLYPMWLGCFIRARAERYRATTALGLLAAIAFASDCSSVGSTSPSGPTHQESTGAMGAQLQIGDNLTISSATYLITGPNGFAVTGPVDVSHSSGLSFTVGGLPAGTGYSVILTATATDGVTTCAGSAMFSVTAGGTTQVIVHLDCHQPSTTGSVSVNGTTNICPTIDAISAIPNQVTVGGNIALTAAAHDPDNGPSPLSFGWTATDGTFLDGETPNATFTCVAVGSPTLTLTVSDGDPMPGCAATATTSVTCAPPDDGGVDDDAPTEEPTDGPIESSLVPESGACLALDGGCIALPPECGTSPSIPSIDFVEASPTVAQVGQTIALFHNVQDPASGDGGVSQISFGPYAWAASSGLLVGGGAGFDNDMASLTCTDVGPVTIWLVVTETDFFGSEPLDGAIPSGSPGLPQAGAPFNCVVTLSATCVADDAGPSGP
jgi:hypothetical protein